MRHLEFPTFRAAWRRIVAAVATSVLGVAMLHTAEDLRRYVAQAPSFVRNQDRAEVRVQAIFIAVIFLLLLVEPLYYVYTVPGAMIAKVASTAPSEWCITGAFGLCFASMLPHLWTLLFRPDLLDQKGYRIAATFSALGASVTWIVLANLAIPMDVGGLEWAYGIRALATLCIAGIYAFSVNSQQLREVMYAPHD
ncbi:hypothetical protein GT347_20370 [Xylophilus rhododendri]|uniref:Uncharacterized protein n=1 Tax=Xylophilus rhododendri TaxID=2697032 RepID=A0A857J8S7_9BURK|nr:hypothetical protein [Xylophilus rhododendri]QHJ00128.1 hypothetical protein GT347_20370 [Xylophilus rhododendri]